MSSLTALCANKLVTPEKSITDLKMAKNWFVSDTTVNEAGDTFDKTTDPVLHSTNLLRKSKSYGLNGSLRTSDKYSALKEIEDNNLISLNNSDIKDIKVKFGLCSSRSS